MDMTMGWSIPRTAAAALLLAGLGGAVAVPAAAQDDARIRKVEAEVKALQRVVFPSGSDSRFFTPEVTPGSPAQSVAVPSGTPSATALTDVLARLDSLEGQVQRLTAQSEEKDNTLAQLKKRFDDAQAALAAAAAPPEEPVIQPTGVIPLPSLSAGSSGVPISPTRVTTTTRPVVSGSTPLATPRAPQTPAATGPTAARLAAVRAIAKPQTADTADDEYSYGYRLWEAGYFPEARQQLALYLQKYPTHAKVSYGRNLLGRAYMDDGQPREAAKYFFDNYQTNKQGPRAPDSLLLLADSMIAISDTSRACIALAEFGDTYPALATGRLKEQYDRTKSKVRCTK
ncbi:MAG: hypothetical protein ABIT09_10225 [Croceibacterium sp.]